jgi:hypothetical protein
MAGEIESGWVKVGLELGAIIASFGGLAMYVKTKLKAHDEQLSDHKAAITDLQTRQANGVRPQDITQINNRLDKIMDHLLKQAEK